MKKKTIHSDKKLISNSIFFIFFIIVLFVGYMSNSMKIPRKSPTDFIQETQAFHSSDLTNINKISLTNNNGVFVFEKNLDTQKWIYSNAEAKVNESIFMDKLFANLQTIKTKNVLEQSPTNLSNLSLLNPQASLTLFSLDDQKETIVHFGLMNTIDNSTYIRFENKKGIYHVEAPAGALENVTLVDIIEARPFEFDSNEVIKFKVSTFYPKALSLEYEKTNDIWSNKSDIDVNQEMINEYLVGLAGIKTTKVLINHTRSQQQNIKDLLKKYPFELSITLKNGKTTNFKITSLIKSFSEISLNDEYHYAITRSDNDSTHFIRSENQSIFTVIP